MANRSVLSEVEDAEEEAREALNDATDGATDADVLAVLLTVAQFCLIPSNFIHFHPI